MILAIDPGTTESAFVLYDETNRAILNHGKLKNSAVERECSTSDADEMAIEMIASYGMPVGREVFETCVAIGRFQHCYEASRLPWHKRHDLVYRAQVKSHLCGSTRAKDANVRQALISAFGGKAKAVGTKKQPGPLYGIKGDCWSALAVAITFADIRDQERAMEAA